MRIWWVLLAVAACGGKSDKPDCAKYGAHMAEVLGAGLPDSRKQSLESSTRNGCESGDVSAKKASCVIAATTADQIRECEGLAPIGFNPSDKPAGKPPAPAAQRVQRKGYSLALPAGWTAKTDKVAPEEVLLRGPSETAGAFLVRVPEAMLGKDEAACRAAGERMAKNTGATFKSSSIVQSKLGPACRTIHTDPKMVIQGDSVPAGAGTMTVTCFYELTRNDSAPYCREIFDSLTLD
jgi:hypothetical protein